MLDRLHERIRCRRFENRMAERQIDDVDVERVLVDDRELNRPNHVVGRTLALVVENLQANQARRRRHAHKCARRKARDVRAVPVAIGWGSDANVALREVVERRNTGAEINAGRDPGIDYGNPTAGML